MKTFEWNDNFQTDLPSVDEQHHHLVDLINKLGDQLNDGDNNHVEIDKLFQELLRYAGYHFFEEESLMQTVGLDDRHITAHKKKHRDFIDRLVLLRDGAKGNLDSIAAELLEYLIHWLTYHILGQDQNMARQIEAVRGGSDRGSAFQDQERPEDQAMDPLLSAVTGLLGRLSAQNEALRELNQSLEQRVADRTLKLAEANRKLSLLSLTDDLTGLPNRRHAIQQLDSIWKESAGAPITALMVDADHFKEINDQHGHDAGDTVLIELARALGSSVRTDDRVYRLGGDEFFVLCPETGQKGALKVAEQLNERVSNLDVKAGQGRWKGSVSIGVATADPVSSSYADLMKAADDALYRAKKAGRSCIRVAESVNPVGV